MAFGDAEKTEKPTPKRKKEAREEGKIARSHDVAAWLVLLAGSFLLPLFFSSAERRVVGLVDMGSAIMSNPTPAAALEVLQTGLGDMVKLVLPLMGAFGAIGLLATVAQTGFALSAKAATPKFSRVNPKTGLKRLLSPSSLWELLKQLLKLSVLVFISYRVIAGFYHLISGTAPSQMGPLVDYTGSSLISMVRDGSVACLILAMADYGYQRHKTNKSLKMTKQEVKDEAKKQDGDPLVKRAIRKRQMSMSRNRMMAAIARSDVVVTNPTHYSVAICYDAGTGSAPRVVAKGAGLVALRIREEATKHKVPIVEDPPLARAIYGACEIDSAIPKELYLAVARLLAFVFTMPAVVRASGHVHRRPSTALVA